MKKVIILLVAFVALAVNAQDKTALLGTDKYYYDLQFDNSDSIHAADSVYYVNVTVNKPEPVKYDVFVSLDSISGSDSVVVKLKGKRFTEESYTSLDAVTWYQSSSDTTFIISEQSTAKYYRLLQIEFEGGADGTQAVEDLKVKLWSK